MTVLPEREKGAAGGAPVAVLLLAKAPRPGAVKTRLIPALGHEGAAELARALLRDTLALITALPWAWPVLVMDPPLPRDLSLRGVEAVWPQGDGDLGARQMRALQRGVARCGAALLLGSDLPGLPAGPLNEARAVLERGRAVLGPALDGGFYLIGLPGPAPGDLLDDLPWSSPDTGRATERRLARRGLEPERVCPWFDLDRPEDLAPLARRLRRGELYAPHTARALSRLLPRPPQP